MSTRHAPLAIVLAAIAVVASCGGPQGDKPQSIDGLDAARMLARARSEVSAQDLDAAERDYHSAYTLRPDAAVLGEYVAFLERIGRDAGAVALAEGYRRDHPGVVADLAYADALVAAGRGSDALPIAETVIAGDARAPAGHVVRGRALMLLDRGDDALVELRAARDLAADAAANHVQLGLALDKLGKLDDALVELRRAVKLAPDDAEANIDLAIALREQQQYREAQKYVDHAIAVAPTSGRAYFELGRLDNAQDKDEAAEAALAKAVEYAPYESLYWYAYGEVFRLHERDDEAIKAYDRALALPRPAPKARAKLGAVLAHAQRWGDAERELDEAVKDYASDPLVQLSLGDVYAATDRAKLALDSYKRYLELAAPDDKDRTRVQQVVAKLQRR